jgi:hypothetical protein
VRRYDEAICQITSDALSPKKILAIKKEAISKDLMKNIRE